LDNHPPMTELETVGLPYRAEHCSGGKPCRLGSVECERAADIGLPRGVRADSRSWRPAHRRSRQTQRRFRGVARVPPERPWPSSRGDSACPPSSPSFSHSSRSGCAKRWIPCQVVAGESVVPASATSRSVAFWPPRASHPLALHRVRDRSRAADVLATRLGNRTIHEMGRNKKA
jgi:hypothetical protein